MNCVIPGPNIKILSKIISTLSKIGDDICLKAEKDFLSLKSVNMTNTSYCTIHLYDIFFSTYELITSDENEDDFICKIPMKAILGVFKSHGHKDRKPEFCKIELQQSDTKIIFTFKYKHDVTVVRSLYLSDGESVNVVYNKNSNDNQICANAQLFAQVLSNFQIFDDDMSLEVTPQKAVIRNYIADNNTRVTKCIRSQLTLMVGEFNAFEINQPTNVTFLLKPFRAAIHFAETFGLVVLLHFNQPGRPARLQIKNPTFELAFIMATFKSDDASSTLSSAVSLAKRTNAPVDRPNPQILENFNWADFNEAMGTDVRKTSSTDKVGSNEDQDADVVSRSPESPRSKRMRSIFGRCYEATFNRTNADLGDLLAPDSDPE